MAEVAVEISTTSTVIPSWKTPPTLPTITMNGNPFPAPSQPFTLASGWQLVVLDSTGDITNPASIRVNQYFALSPDSGGFWSDTYGWTYNGIGRWLLSAGNPETQLVFLASFGWDNNAPPTSFMLSQLLNIGAGPQIQQWSKNNEAGSESGWVQLPCSYILIGGSSYEYGLGYEAYTGPSTNPANAQVSATIGSG